MEKLLPSKRLISATSGWRFSLRELLLLVTAASALIALGIKSYPSQATSFFNHFDAQDELNGLFNDFGIKLGSSSGSSGGSSGSGQRRRGWNFGSHQDQYSLGQIGFAYKQRVEAKLRANNCRILGSSTFGDQAENRVSAFGYSYQQGATHGEFFAEFVDLSNGNFRVHAFCAEFPRR